MTFVLPTAVAVDAARKIYVTEFNINTLYVFPPWATGSTPPTETISGPATGIAGPDGIGVDAAGNMYVSNRNGNSVTVFAPGANGNAAWGRAVVGPLTTLTNPQQIVVNPAGDFYVAAVQRQRLPARRSRQSSNPHTRRARSAAVEALRNGAPSFLGDQGRCCNYHDKNIVTPVEDWNTNARTTYHRRWCRREAARASMKTTPRLNPLERR